MAKDKRKDHIARRIAGRTQQLITVRNITRAQSYIEGFRDGWRCSHMSTEDLVALFGERMLPESLVRALQLQ